MFSIMWIAGPENESLIILIASFFSRSLDHITFSSFLRCVTQSDGSPVYKLSRVSNLSASLRFPLLCIGATPCDMAEAATFPDDIGLIP